MPRFDQPIEPMTLGNMRQLGVRSLDVSCWNCHHQAVLSADRWPDDVVVPTFGPRMVCTGCGIVGADARPRWREQPPRGHGEARKFSFGFKLKQDSFYVGILAVEARMDWSAYDRNHALQSARPFQREVFPRNSSDRREQDGTRARQRSGIHD
jgi:hypothetical protein